MDITRDQALAVVQAALDFFRAEVDSDITAPRILTLLTTVKHPGIQQTAIPDHVKGVAQSTVSRNVLDWTNLTSSRKPGPDFIAQRSDPEYRKRNVLFPTPKGLDFVNRLGDHVAKRVKNL